MMLSLLNPTLLYLRVMESASEILNKTVLEMGLAGLDLVLLKLY